jgi:hypothetical protein
MTRDQIAFLCERSEDNNYTRGEKTAKQGTLDFVSFHITVNVKCHVIAFFFFIIIIRLMK